MLGEGSLKKLPFAWIIGSKGMRLDPTKELKRKKIQVNSDRAYTDAKGEALPRQGWSGRDIGVFFVFQICKQEAICPA